MYHEHVGWIKIHRKIWDNPIFYNPNIMVVWLWILTHAEHGMKKDGETYREKTIDEYRKVTIGEDEIPVTKGMLTCGRLQISDETRVSASSVQRALRRLEVEHLIEQQSDNKKRVLTVLKWSLYQGSEQQDEQQVNTSRTSSEHQVNTIKELKNINNKKNEIVVALSAPTPAQEANEFFSDISKQELAIKMLTDKQIPRDVAKKEIENFIGYWTELNKTGTKERWEMEKTFELKRRLTTWINKSSVFSKKSFNKESKGIII